MSEMVERCARVICKLQGRDPDGCMSGGGVVTADGSLVQTHVLLRWWQAYEEHARAAITAMRDPTDTMVVVGLDADVKGPTFVWEAMVDEALR